MLGIVGAAVGGAGVAAPVGGCEARADVDAWGVGAPDMMLAAPSEAMCRASLVLSCGRGMTRLSDAQSWGPRH